MELQGRFFGIDVPDGNGRSALKQETAFAENPRHLPLMEALNGERNISQRSLAERLDLGLSVVNRLLRDLLSAGYLEVVDDSVRPYAYRLTEPGETYRRRLSHQHLSAVVDDFWEVRDRIQGSLQEIHREGLRRLVFYGAGRIMEVTLSLARALGLQVVGIVDDDEAKQGRWKGGLRVGSPESIAELAPCGVLITSFRHADEIRAGLRERLQASVRVIEL